MKITFLPRNSEIKFEIIQNIFFDTLPELCKDETTIIISESMRSLFNLSKLEGKPPAIELEALVFTVADPPVFLARLHADLGEKEKHLAPAQDGISTYVENLVRSLTSTIHTFSEDSISIATVIVDSDDLSSLEKNIAEAKSRLPASRRGMTEAAYDNLKVAVTAAIGLQAFAVDFCDSDPQKLSLIDDLKRNKGRLKRLFSALGNVILHLEDVQSPRISSSLTQYGLVSTLDLTKPTLVVCSDRNRELLDNVLRKFKWEVATSPTGASTSPTYDNVVVVDLDEKEASQIATVSKVDSTTLWIHAKVSSGSESAPSPSESQPACDLNQAPQRTSDSKPMATTIKEELPQLSGKSKRKRSKDEEGSAKRPKGGVRSTSDEKRITKRTGTASEGTSPDLLKPPHKEIDDDVASLQASTSLSSRTLVRCPTCFDIDFVDMPSATSKPKASRAKESKRSSQSPVVTKNYGKTKSATSVTSPNTTPSGETIIEIECFDCICKRKNLRNRGRCHGVLKSKKSDVSSQPCHFGRTKKFDTRSLPGDSKRRSTPLPTRR